VKSTSEGLGCLWERKQALSEEVVGSEFYADFVTPRKFSVSWYPSLKNRYNNIYRDSCGN
jgi:methyltransferase-like protein